MNLKAYDRATREAIIAAGQDRELFTLCGNGMSADYLIKSTAVQCDHQGEYVYAELTQVSNALLAPPKETPAPWQGPEDGLPPVGTVCDFSPSGAGSIAWQKVEIVAHFKASIGLVAAYVPVNGTRQINQAAAGRFRPIRTPEQIKTALQRLHDGHWEALKGQLAVSPTAWNGPEDGLPPVGLEVEVLWSSVANSFCTGLIVGHDADRAVFRFTTGDRKGEYQADKLYFDRHKGQMNFRPIRTPEQIKAEQREKDIVELLNVFPTLNGSPLAYAQAAIDAGYRKFEIVDEQP